MRSPFLLFLISALLISACVPGYHRLKAHEAALKLSEGTIYLVLDDRQEEAELYASYGYAKRAARLHRADQKTWDMFAEAITHFHACAIEIQWATSLPSESFRDLSYFMTLERHMKNQGERQEEVLTLVLRDHEGTVLPAAFPYMQEVGGSLSRAGLNYAFREWDKRILRAYTKAVEAKEGSR